MSSAAAVGFFLFVLFVALVIGSVAGSVSMRKPGEDLSGPIPDRIEIEGEDDE